jgi:hypothetical protein
MHNCKCPNKLTVKAYREKILEEYKCHSEFALSEEARRCLLTYVLESIVRSIEGSSDNFEEVLEYLLQINSSSQAGNESRPNVAMSLWRDLNVLLLIFSNPIEILALIKRLDKLNLNKTQDDQCINFLQKVTLRCIPDIVQANRVTLQRPSKTVRFTIPEKQEPPRVEVSQRRDPMSDLEKNIEVTEMNPGAGLK